MTWIYKSKWDICLFFKGKERERNCAFLLQCENFCNCCEVKIPDYTKIQISFKGIMSCQMKVEVGAGFTKGGKAVEM